MSLKLSFDLGTLQKVIVRLYISLVGGEFPAQLRSTQPGHPFVSRCNEYQPKGDDTLWLGSKGRYGSRVGGR